MSNHYKSSPFRAPWVAASRLKLPKDILSAPLRSGANAMTRISKELASWVVTWRFLAGLDRYTTDFYRDIEGRGEPSTNAQTKNAKS